MLRLICCPREAITPRNGSSTRPLCSTVLTVNPDNSQALEQAGPIDLAPLAGADFAFRRPGIGALLTMAQSWYAQGVALGQLLHSVALVPGESTRIAMLDWSRPTTGKQAEDVTETEALSNIMEHSRAFGGDKCCGGGGTIRLFGNARNEFGSAERRRSRIQPGSSHDRRFIRGAPLKSDAMGFSSSSWRYDLSAAMTQKVVDAHSSTSTSRAIAWLCWCMRSRRKSTRR